MRESNIMAPDTVGQQRPNPRFWAEIGLIFLVLLLYAGQLAPNVNETHYLTKAKHFWNPNWCPDDLFLSSSFSHYLFYLTTGWLTLFLSLEAYAWLGRILCWVGFSIGWYKLSQVFSNRPGRAFLGIILFLLLMDRFHLAGEWAIGGFEAKSIAYVFILFALEKYFRQKWNMFWPLIGCACAFHVLVGGWALIGLLMGSLLARLGKYLRPTDSNDDNTVMKFPAVSVTFFAALFALGAIPPLLQQAASSASVNQMAFQVYVHERLPHHLLFGGFATSHIGRFALLCVIWLCFASFLKKIPAVLSMNLFCAASLLISLTGLLLSGAAETVQGDSSSLATWATGWLRFYWFRLSDFAIPLGISMMCVTALNTPTLERSGKNQITEQLVTLFSILLIVFAGTWMLAAKWEDPRAPADRASLPSYQGDTKRTLETQANWEKACDWIRNNTPTDAVFITPNDQQTFKWYAQRSEIVNWKDIPQTGAATLEWKRRINSLYRTQQIYPSGLLQFEEPEKIAKAFGADFLLIEQSAVDVLPTSVNLKQVYPVDPQKKSTYVIFQFD